MALKPVGEMTREEKLAELQGYGIDPFASPAGLKPVEEMTREEKLAELRSYGIGGPASFGESFQKGVEGLVPPVARTIQGIATIAEDKFGWELDPVKEYGKDVRERSNQRLAAMPMRDKTTFRDVEDAVEKDLWGEGLSTFGQ